MKRLSPRRDPVRLALSGAPWRAAWCLFSYVFVGTVLLLGLFAPLLALDFAVAAIWLIFLAGITLPIWYWAPRQTFGTGAGSGSAHGVQLGYFPHGPHGRPGYGLYVDTLPKALLAAGICLVLFLLFNYVLVAAARLHAKVARTLLGAQEDPLREAKDLLQRPGPLAQFIMNLSRTGGCDCPTREGPAHGWGPGNGYLHK
jgi:hypothetical protein